MKHIHHITPKHMGGTDDPSNLIELTVEEHAEAHRILFENYGKKEDWLAWQGLSKLISKEQILKELCSHKGESHPMYGKRGKNSPLYGRKRPEHSKHMKLNSPWKRKTKEHIDKLNNRFTKEYLENVSDSISRNWKITTPDGEILYIRNMAKFCRENNLSNGGMSTSFKTKKPYKGYLCEKLG